MDGTPQYKPGDVVDGYVLTASGEWVALAPASPPTAAPGPPAQPGLPSEPGTAHTARGSRNRLVVTLAVVIVALAVGGVAYAHSKNTNTATATVPAAPNTHSVTVTFALHDLNTVNNGCVGTGGYSDIGPGTQAILSDQDGKVLGSGDLGPGDSDGVATCTYTATISNVPTDRDQYVVEVSHRGKIVNSHSEMVAAGWSFSLTMGS